MGLEVQPTVSGLLVFFGIVLFIVIATATTGSLITLAMLAVIIVVALYLAYVGGRRVTRYLMGV